MGHSCLAACRSRFQNIALLRIEHRRLSISHRAKMQKKSSLRLVDEGVPLRKALVASRLPTGYRHMLSQHLR